MLVEMAPAKVNLSLLITGRRADGYHLLDSIVVFGPVWDEVRAGPGQGLSLSLTGPFAAGLTADGENLVLCAARDLAQWAGVPPNAALVLDKRLPVASGIGGGSADAAATLRVLCRLWALRPTIEEMLALALGLGADVPVCLASRPARMTGVGEILSPLPPMPPFGLLLANPGLAVATADVFRARAGAFSHSADLPEAWGDAGSMVSTLMHTGNDLEAPAASVCPAIIEVIEELRALPGCLLARMSGSGATCFALFADAAAAARAGALLPDGWWRAAGPLYEPPAAALLTHTVGWGVAKR